MDGNHDIDVLIARCREGSAEERCAAIADLQDLHARAAVPVLRELLAFDDAGVRANAACALGTLGAPADDDVIEALAAALSADSDELVRIQAAEALGLLGSAAGAPALLRALGLDGAALVRVHAAEALGLIGDPGALPGLQGALADPDASVRAYAADAIGSLGYRDPGAARALLAQHLTVEPSAFARAFVLAAMVRLGDDDSLVALVALAESADDTLAVTIWNLAADLATPRTAAALGALFTDAARARPGLRHELDALQARLAALA